MTGTRAEYGLLRSTLDAIRESASLELMLVVTGMHLLAKFGRTLRDIQRDGYPIAARVPMQRGDDSTTDQAAGLARGVAGMARVFARRRPDVVLVLGDRIEALAAALAAATSGIPLAHIHGGDLAQGDFDDKLRDAITRLADIHFPASPAAAARLVRMGVPRSRVHRVAAPGLDDARRLITSHPRARAGRRHARTAAPKRSGGGMASPADESASRSCPNGTALVIQHAYGRSPRVEERVAADVLDACAACGLRRIIIVPNSDRGHAGVLRAIRSHLRASPAGTAVLHESLPRDDFLRSLAQARALVGNSSAGLLEAPFLGTPAVNVGDRQKGRAPGGRGVIHARESRLAIESALRRAMKMQLRPGAAKVYGAGRAGACIAAHLTAQLS